MLRVVCQPTYTCSRRNQTIERSNFECCPGFQVRPAESSSHYEYMFLLYYTRARALPVGCPRGTITSPSLDNPHTVKPDTYRPLVPV